MKFKPLSSRSSQAFIGLILVYLALIFILPASTITKANYNISSEQYHALLFAVRLPIVAGWCVAFYSYRWLHIYAHQIKDTAEGNDFAMIARGIQWIAWGLPAAALCSSLTSAIANQIPHFTSANQIITGYPYVVIILVAFYYISAGSHNLAERSRIRLGSHNLRLFFLVIVSCSVLFCALIASRLHGLSVNDSYNSYYLPNWLVWTTIVMPYMYAAFIGLFAGMELMLIGRRTSGVIYSQALQMLAYGIVLVIFGLCALQYFRSIIPRTGHLAINFALITTYIIYGITTIGWILLASGAKRLKRIEDL